MSEDRKIIYLDNAATTRTSPKVVEEMLPFFSEYYGNPSSVYEFSNASKKAVAQARQVIADSLGAKPQEIYFLEIKVSKNSGVYFSENTDEQIKQKVLTDLRTEGCCWL